MSVHHLNVTTRVSVFVPVGFLVPFDYLLREFVYVVKPGGETVL